VTGKKPASAAPSQKVPVDLLVVQPDPLGPLDRFDGWLGAAGVRARIVRPYLGELVPEAPDGDGLLVLGGSMGAYEDAEYPWLADVRRLLQRTVDLSHPTLGICLGGQLLAQAGGGTVVPGAQGTEAGVVAVELRDEAQNDALFAGLPSPFLAGAMHGDAIVEQPEAAVWLASTALYPHQAFRLGSAAWGLQFHPEVSPATYETWVHASGATDHDTIDRLQKGIEVFAELDNDVIGSCRILALRFAAMLIPQAGGD
jgi:GMP synthase (glutamine-hydrolysing)